MTDAPTAARLPRPVDQLEAVSRMREGGSERRPFIGLDRNERLVPLPTAFLEALRESIDGQLLMNYPAVDELEDELAAAVGLPKARLLVTQGIDPAVKALHQAYIRAGDGVVILDPSYAMYDVYARMFGAIATRVGYDDDLEADGDLLLESIVQGVKLVMLANPNQPTGTVLADEVLRAALMRCADVGALLVVDEAYSFFSPATAWPLLDESPNAVVLRSYSKAGLAGVRLGYVAGAEEVLQALFKVRSAAEVNAFAILCGRTLLRHPEVIEELVRETEAGRELLAARAEQLGLTPLRCWANFTQIRLNGRAEPAAVVETLRGLGWLVKGPSSTPALRDCIRVTLGGPELMARFADSLETALPAP